MTRSLAAFAALFLILHRTQAGKARRPPPSPPQPTIGAMNKLIQPLYDRLSPWAQDWVGVLMPLIEVTLIAVTAWLLMRVARHLIRRLTGTYGLPVKVTSLFLRTVGVLVYGGALLWVLERLGVSGAVLWTAFTGFATVDYAQWPVFAPILMLFLCGFATCAGSTGGGVKMIRVWLLVKQAHRELVRAVVHQDVLGLDLRIFGRDVLEGVLQHPLGQLHERRLHIQGLGLEQAVRLAVDWHPRIGEAIGTLYQQGEGINVAESGYYPQVSGGIRGGYTSGYGGDASSQSVSRARPRLLTGS